MEITGGCLCRAVRYRSSAAPIVTRWCWCRLCQYLGGGAGTVNVCFRTESFQIEGATSEFHSVAESGTPMMRRFCTTCGTPVFSEAKTRPHLIFVRAGTLDDPEIAKPAQIIWRSQAPSWACIDESIPSLSGQAPPAA